MPRGLEFENGHMIPTRFFVFSSPRHLKAELHNAPHAERFALILEEYLSHCGRFSHELRKQSQAVRKLQRVAELVVKLKREHGYGDEEVIKEYRRVSQKITRLLVSRACLAECVSCLALCILMRNCIVPPHNVLCFLLFSLGLSVGTGEAQHGLFRSHGSLPDSSQS